MAFPSKGFNVASGGVSVTTTYGATLAATLDAGFTCSSGRKYHAWADAAPNGYEELLDQYTTAIMAGATSISVLNYTNTLTVVTPEQLIADIKELMINYRQARTHNYAA